MTLFSMQLQLGSMLCKNFKPIRNYLLENPFETYEILASIDFDFGHVFITYFEKLCPKWNTAPKKMFF